MFILLFLLWLIFNGTITLETVIFGIVISGLIYWFGCSFMGMSPKKELRYAKKAGIFLEYVAVLFVEVIKANIVTIKMVLSHRYDIEPVIVSFDVHFETRLCRVLFANSITLTPGTITVDIIGDRYKVHALDISYTDGINGGKIADILHRMEADDE